MQVLMLNLLDLFGNNFSRTSHLVGVHWDLLLRYSRGNRDCMDVLLLCNRDSMDVRLLLWNHLLVLSILLYGARF